VDISLPGGIWSLSPLAALIGVIVLIFLMLTNERLYTRGQYRQGVDAEKRRGDEWKETALEYRSAIRELEARSVVLPDIEAAAALRRVKNP
jgi:hypothetical protein